LIFLVNSCALLFTSRPANKPMQPQMLSLGLE